MKNESSFGLLTQAKAGDRLALDRLMVRYLARLRRWASRRLPGWARDVHDTEDLVQETLLNAFRNLQNIRMQHHVSLRVYMRHAIQNRITDEVQRALRRPPGCELTDRLPSASPGQLQHSMTRQDLARCRVALARLRPAERRLVLLRLSEPDLSFRRLAALTGKPSEDAARVAFARALSALAREMERLESTGSRPDPPSMGSRPAG